MEWYKANAQSAEMIEVLVKRQVAFLENAAYYHVIVSTRASVQ